MKPAGDATHPNWNRPVFVVGPQRCGTTLVGRILASTPQSAFTVNGKLLYYLERWTRAQSRLELQHFRADEIVHAMRRKPILGVPDDFVDTLVEPELHRLARKLVDKPAPLDLDPLIRATLMNVHRTLAPGATLWGDKYNEYLFMLPRIRELFPAARFVVIGRNSDHAAASMRRAFDSRPWCPSSLNAARRKHEAWWGLWTTFAAQHTQVSSHVMSYETLVAQPRYTLARLAEFLDVDDEDFAPWLQEIRSTPATQEHAHES